MIKPFLKYGLAAVLVSTGIYFWRGASPAKTVLLPKTPAGSSAAHPILLEPRPIVLAAPKVAPVVAAVPIQLNDINELKPQMESFMLLNKKIIKTDDEKEQFASLLKDSRTLKNVRGLLLRPTKTDADLQNQALDLVIESLKAGQSEALDVLASFVADPSLELGGQDASVQQFKAELKAQALLEWSSQQPQQSQYIESILPGPISKRIWQNVMAHQNNNVAESESEAIN